jgi:hypothetical protein
MVPIPPWYRSRLFLAGLFGAISLLWGWLAFPRQCSSAQWKSSGKSWWLADSSGCLVAGFTDDRGIGGSLARNGFECETWDGFNHLTAEDKRLFPPPFRSHSAVIPGALEIKIVAVAYWVLLLGYLLIWLGLLWWWTRWKEACRAEQATDVEVREM